MLMNKTIKRYNVSLVFNTFKSVVLGICVSSLSTFIVSWLAVAAGRPMDFAAASHSARGCIGTVFRRSHCPADAGRDVEHDEVRIHHHGPRQGIVGACCVGVLAIRLRLDSQSSFLFTQIFGSAFKPDAASLYIPIALIGLGYCYVASTPITVLHLGRYSRWWLDSHSRHFWFGWLPNRQTPLPSNARTVTPSSGR